MGGYSLGGRNPVAQRLVSDQSSGKGCLSGSCVCSSVWAKSRIRLLLIIIRLLEGIAVDPPGVFGLTGQNVPLN